MDAILSAVQNAGINATSVSGIQCGNGWAGASYETPQATGAALLRAQGNHWVGANRAQDCNDPAIPPAGHFYCTASCTGPEPGPPLGGAGPARTAARCAAG